MKRPIDKLAVCNDSSCEYLVNPIPRPKMQILSISTRPKRERVFLIDSRKPNSLFILRRTQELLRARGIEVVDQIYVKSDPSRPLDAATLDWIAREEGLILCGVAD
jgi:hypothetical protein